MSASAGLSSRKKLNAPLGAGSTIGILGGGQLGRMIALAAAELGIKTHVYAPEADGVAAEVADAFTQADYNDVPALTLFAEACDVLTFEFENVPVGPLAFLQAAHVISPPLPALEIAQSRIAEKQFVADLDGRTAPFAYAENAAQMADGLAEISGPAIAKTNRMGYDGKGQLRLNGGEDAAFVWTEMGRQPILLEGFVDFFAEFSVIMARRADGAAVFYDSAQNVHDDGILALSKLPADPRIQQQIEDARALTRKIAEALEYVGILSVEFFASDDGPVFNEMAPRVHNSGHWTIEGAVISQFQNHVRAICGLPLGDTSMTGSRIEMHNLLGEAALDLAELLKDGCAHVHNYGKAEAREGRKMGHMTRIWRD